MPTWKDKIHEAYLAEHAHDAPAPAPAATPAPAPATNPFFNATATGSCNASKDTASQLYEGAKETGLAVQEGLEIAESDVPVVGTMVNGAESLYYDAKTGIDVMKGDKRAAYEDAGKAGAHAVKAIPVVGTAIGLDETYNHAVHNGKKDLDEQISEKAFGEKPEESADAKKPGYGSEIGKRVGGIGGPIPEAFGEYVGSLFD